jgi:alpha-L-fucosidase
VQYEADKDSIGYWTEAGSTVSWKFDVKAPGTFKTYIVQACESGPAGSEYQVSVGDSSVKGVVKATGSWDSFTTVDLGELTIPAKGTYTLTVKAVSKPSFAVMNLRALTLTPLETK